MNKFGDVPLKCVEIGVKNGDNAYEMLSYAPNIHLTLVDNYRAYSEEPQQKVLDDAYKNMLLKLDKFKDRITVVKKTSEEASKMFQDCSFDYVYIDGEHTVLAVAKDILCWNNKVKDFGIISGHDFYLVKEAVYSIYKETRQIIYSCNVENMKIIPENYTDCLDWWVHKEIHDRPN
jgi:hypothetical protein